MTASVELHKRLLYVIHSAIDLEFLAYFEIDRVEPKITHFEIKIPVRILQNDAILLVKFCFCSDFRYESNGIFVLGVGLFSSEKFRLFN